MWQPVSSVARRGDAIEVTAWDQQRCTHRGFQERTVRVDYTDHPDPGVLTVEATLATLGVIVLANASDDGSDEEQALTSPAAAVGGVILYTGTIALVIAATADLLEFSSGSRNHVEYTPLPVRVTTHATRPRAGVPVRLALDDGDTVQDTTDAHGRAQLMVIATPNGKSEVVYGELDVGGVKQRVRLRR